MSRAPQRWGDYLGVVVGSAVVALGLDLFLVPNKIAAGGISGLATVVHYVFGWPVGITMLAANIPLFAFGVKTVGLRFGMKTAVGTAATSIFVDLLAPWLPALTQDPALAAIYGGVVTGVGIGITFRYGGSTGGTDMAARILNHYTHLSVGRSLLIFDGIVIVLAGVTFNAELALYAFLAVFLASKTIDLVQEGPRYGKAALIISEHSQAIGKRVLNEIDRGATSLRGQGLYTESERDVLLVVVARHEIHRLRKLVHEEDPKAFMIIADVADVLGEGFGILDAGS